MAGAARRALVALGLPASRLATDLALADPAGALPRLARMALGYRLHLIAPHIDAGHYMSQLPDAWRAAAKRDPILHYALVGRFREFSPRPGFDPRFYRADNPDLGWGADPVAHYASRGATGPTSELDVVQASAASPPTRGAILTLTHNRGGGSNLYLRLYEDELMSEGFEIVRLARDTIKTPLVRPVSRSRREPVGPAFHLLEEPDLLAALAVRTGATRLILNHFVDLPVELFAQLPRQCRDLGLPIEIVLHDYLALCPRINLVDRTQSFCGGPGTRKCRACVAGETRLATEIDPSVWRQVAAGLLRSAERIVAPSGDLADRMREHWPDLAITVREPEDDRSLDPPLAPRLGPGERLRIVIVGALNVPKGFDVVASLAEHVQTSGLPLDIHLLGSSPDDSALRTRGISVTGRYREAEAEARLAELAAHVAFVPAIWPESWSFTTTIALRARLPVVAFDLGAVAARLRRLGWGTLLPPGRARDVEWLAEQFLAIRAKALDDPP